MIEENKHYVLRNPMNNTSGVYKILNVHNEKVNVFKLVTKEKSTMNKNYVIKNNEPCPITKETLNLFGFKSVNMAVYSDTKSFVAVFIQANNLAGHKETASYSVLGYAIISESEISEVIRLYEECRNEGWEKRIKDRFNLVHYIDDII